MSKSLDLIRTASAAVLALALASPLMAGPLGLGRAATADEVAAWDTDVRPDGVGLPEGAGDVTMGEEVFAEKCAICHGVFGEGVDRWPVLAGGRGTLTSDRPVKTMGSYWPYLSTAFDYIQRAMPFGDAESLEPDETYAIVAYLLYVNDIMGEDFELSKDNFMTIHMPNEKNFFMDDRDVAEAGDFREACMTDCKTDVRIVKRAAVLDVTPDTAVEQ
ncbi:MAG: cytochrome c [Paracoccaceae bacterium]|jgi:cytochrome c